jgi:hypothetical protein
MSEEDKVSLKPFLGMRPGVWLSILYSAIILLILFFVLIFPGLLRPGSILSVKSGPWGAAVRLDGVYRGTAPCEFFVPAGVHTVELVLPGFTSYRDTREIPGRIPLSLFFPSRVIMEETLTTAEPLAALQAAAVDYAAWTFAGEPTPAWQIPQSLSEGAYRTGPYFRTAAARAGADDLLKAAGRFAITRAGLRDLIRAKTLIDSGGLSPSPLSLTRSAADILAWLSASPGAASWLAETLPKESAEAITGSPWYRAATTTAGDTDGNSTKSGVSSRNSIGNSAGIAAIEGLNFREIPGGTLVRQDTFPRNTPVEGFFMSETAVTAVSFSIFLAANPQWGLDNLPELLEQGLVTQDYLSGTALSADISGGVSSRNSIANGVAVGASWYAANAYCEWLTGQLPAALAGWEARLPTEFEWEYAAKLLLEQDGAVRPGLTGNTWEWCADPYAPLDFFPVSAAAAEALGSAERPVRGGSPVNAGLSPDPETRGSLPPASCSPFVSFRPVIAPKGDSR